MANQKKCVICGRTIDNNEACVPYKNRYAHEFCFSISIKAIKTNKDERIKEKAEEKKISAKTKKPKAELKDALSEEEYKEKMRLINYIKSYYETDNGILPAKVYILIEKYISQYNYTYETIYKTLVYMKEILTENYTGDALGIVPYKYEEAMDYYKDLEQLEQNNKDKNINDMYNNRVIYVKPKKRKTRLLSVEDI